MAGKKNKNLWEVESNVTERFSNTRVKKENITFIKDTFTFNSSGSPGRVCKHVQKLLRPYDECFEAAKKNGKASDLQHELEELFNNQNKSHQNGSTSISANFLRVTVV